MLDEALALLDAGGSAALTMRALGRTLGVNPMTVHHHFGGRDGLITALADRVYAGVVPPDSAEPRAALEALLRGYGAKVARHPALTLEIFQSRAAFPAQAHRISASVVASLRAIGLSPARALLWRDLLVDYLHGAALAGAMRELGEAPGDTVPEPIENELDPLAELLDAMVAGESRRRV
jgi:AcrR family transcriptional regulator